MDVVELYAGKARISKLASWCGWSSRALDVDYHPPQENVPDPIPGQLRISQQALDARMRCMMKSTAYGTSKVPGELIGMWKKKGKERKSLEKLFQSIGFDKVCHAKTLELVHLEKWFVLNRSLFSFCLTLLSLVLF